MSGERAYIYAKACGIIGKSFVGTRIRALSGLTRLAELDRLVFPDSGRELPERELLPDLERRIAERAVEQISSIVACFQKPPEMLSLLVRSYEYADLKTVISALANNEPKPRITNIGAFRTVNFDAYPKIESMLKNTEFALLFKETGEYSFGNPLDTTELHSKIDKLYYTRLYKALNSLPRTDRAGIADIIKDEIRLRNASWALRLRAYYDMSSEKIKSMLIYIKDITEKDDLARDALESLEFSLDTQNDWEKWKWSRFVNEENPSTASSFWRIDPRYFQNKASRYLYKRAYRNFHSNPFSLLPVFCFVRIKQFEEDLLTSAAEGFSFGLPCRETLGLLGVA